MSVTLESGRARSPDVSDVAVSGDGVRLAYDIFGSGDPTIVLLPSTPIVHSRQWKGQVPYLSRRYRVVTYDGRGNGRSDRPTDVAAYDFPRHVADLEAILDGTGTPAAVLVGLCGDGVWPAMQFAAANPSRVLGIVAFAIGVPLLSPPHPWRAGHAFEEERDSYEGWDKINRHYWQRDYRGFAEFFFGAITTEPHSTKVIEDAVSFAVDGSVDAMLADAEVDFTRTRDEVEELCRSVRCPMLLVHGTEDHCQPIARAHRLHEITGAALVVVDGADHMIPARHPVKANLLIRDFVESIKGGVE
jgi:pimeloyl-ACP methyl ester carboxylesterase